MRPAGVATALHGWMERYPRAGVDWDRRSLYGACAAARVEGVETDPQPDELAILRDLGLSVPGSYVGVPLASTGEDTRLAAACLPTLTAGAD